MTEPNLVFHCERCGRVFRSVDEMISVIDRNGRPTNKGCPECKIACKVVDVESLDITIERIQDQRVEIADIPTIATPIRAGDGLRAQHDMLFPNDGLNIHPSDPDDRDYIAMLERMYIDPAVERNILEAGGLEPEIRHVIALDDGYVRYVGREAGVAQKSWAGCKGIIEQIDQNWTTIRVTDAPKSYKSQIGKAFRTRTSSVFVIDATIL